MSQLSNLRVNIAGHSLVPLFIGGMGVNISTAELASVASSFGAVGHISDAMVLWVADRNTGSDFTKQKSEKFRLSAATLEKSSVKFDLSEVREAEAVHVADAMEKKRGPGAVFINIMEKLSMGDPLETLRARLHGALDGGIDGITLSAGLHSHSLKLMEEHPRFKSTAVGIIVSSDRALKIFLRSAARVGRMPDYIVVEGPLAGGHLGFGEDWREYTLAGVTEKVLELLKEEKLEIPVFGAGGIFNSEDAKSLIALGASGVQVATRFAVTAESGLPYDVKQHYIAAREEDVVVNSVSPTGY